MRRWLAILLVVCLLCPTAQASENTKYVALTFDDGPSGRYTRRLLEGLKQRQVQATFLLCGYRMAEEPALTQAIFDQGHEIGLHGFRHGDMAKMSYREMVREIADTAALLPKGCKPAFLRPPGGSFADNTLKASRDAGLSLLRWSVDPRDWATHDAAAVEAAVVETIRDGDVILLHDMCDCSVDAALAIIDRLHAQGFRFVTVSELARIKGIALQPGAVYTCFR